MAEEAHIVDRQPLPLGQNLTEPIYNAILKAISEEPDRLDLLLSLLHPSDIADLLERLPNQHRGIVLHKVPQDIFGNVLSNVESAVQERLLEEMTAQEVNAAVAKLPSDDVADLLQNMSDEQAIATLRLIPEIQQALLNYEEDTAGGLMQLETLAVPQTWTVARLMDYLRDGHHKLPNNIATIYITDPTRRLLGTISLTRLVQINTEKRLSEVMRTDPFTVMPEVPQTDVAQMFEKYDLIALAVIDKNNRLLGQITIDDVMDVILEEHHYEMMHQAGVSDEEDLFGSTMHTTQKRLPWLVINLFTAILASIVIGIFEGTIQELVALAVLMPIVASMGGNAGTQTLTVTIRGLVQKKITSKNAFSLLKKEFLVGSFNGFVLGVLLAGGTAVVYGNLNLGLVIFAATIANHIFAAVSGNLIPLILERRGIDPAIASGILITTVTDVMGFFTFLGLAALILV